MARYHTIFAGPVEKTQPMTLERPMGAALLPGTIVRVNATGQFVAATTQGLRGAYFILSENTLAQQSTDDTVAQNATGIGYYPDQNCFFHVLVEGGSVCVAEVTLLTSKGDGVAEVGASDDEVLFVAAETYTVPGADTTSQLVLVRPYFDAVP